MDDLHQRVLEETKRFWAVLPKLLETIPGRWVVFKDGVVHGDYATHEEALDAGINQFGLDGGEVIAPVRPNIPVVLSAGSLYQAPK
jgi:hypothetical protein